MLVADSVRDPLALVGIIIETRHPPLALTPRADHPHWCILHEATLGSGVTGFYQAFPHSTPWKFPPGHIGAPPRGERTCAGPALALLMSGDGAARRQSGGNHGRIARHWRRDRAALRGRGRARHLRRAHAARRRPSDGGLARDDGDGHS